MRAAAVDFAAPLGRSPVADLTIGVNEFVNGLAGVPTLRAVAGHVPPGTVRAEVEPTSGYDVMVGAGVWLAVVGVLDAASVRLIDPHGETVARVEIPSKPI